MSLNFRMLLCLLLTFAMQSVTAVQLINQNNYQSSMRRNWAIEDGLPQISITGIDQDKAGYLWLTTEGGLVRFDGMKFELFDAEKSALLANPLLKTVLVTEQDQVIFASNTKLLQKIGNQFIEMKYAGDSIAGTNVLIQNAAGTVFIGANQLFQLKQQQIQPVPGAQFAVFSMTQYGDDVWVGGINQLGVVKQGIFQAVAIEWPYPQMTVTQLGFYQQQIYVGTSHGLFTLSATNQLLPVQWNAELAESEILSIYTDRRQNLWVSTYGALYRIYDGAIVERIDRNDAGATPWVISTFEDLDGDLWLGSKSVGLTRLRADATENFSLAHGLADPYVWAFLPMGQRLLVAHNQGLAWWDNGKFSSAADLSSLANKVVYTLFQDRQQQVWAGSRAGLSLLTLDAQQQLQISRTFPELAQVQINGIAEDQQGNIWIGSLGGLFKFSAGQITQITDAQGLRNHKIRYVYVDPDNTLWVGTEQGLYQQINQQFELLPDTTLAQSHITFINTLHSGDLIVGTFQSGFVLLQQQQWRWFKPEDGLPAKTVLYAKETAAGLVISNMDGVYLLPPQSLLPNEPLQPRHIVEDKGPSARYDSYRCCNGAGNAKGAFWDNHIWLPTLNGVVSIDVAKLDRQVRLPQPVIEGLRTNQQLYLQSQIELEAKQRNWHIKFSAPIFYRAASLVFRYQLRGFDEDWQLVGDRREAFYTNLPPGDYQFAVQTRYLGETQWSQPTLINISLAAYWYQSLLGKFLLFSLALLAGYGLYLFRVRQLALAKHKLEQMVAARTQELAESNVLLAAANEKLSMASTTDALTGLHNRRFLNSWLAEQRQKHPINQPILQIVLLDLDNFKQINDSLGHLVGDEILVSMARLLQQEVRNTDHVVRWGGEEFLVIQERSQSSKEFVQRLQEKICLYPWPHQDRLLKAVSVSMGVVQHPPLPNGEWTWDATLTLADKALYLVKTHGKAGWLKLTPNIKAPTDLALQLPELPEMTLLNNHWFEMSGSANTLEQINTALNVAGTATISEPRQ